MTNKKIYIEHELKSKSPNIIWPLLSTPEGWTKWIANEVKAEGDAFVFTWGNEWSHHEKRRAIVIGRKDYEFIRLQWLDDEHRDVYWELRMEKSDLTGDYILIITDFAIDGDKDTVTDIWTANLEDLHRSSGL